MLVAVALPGHQEQVIRTPAIYRCPQKEAESKFFAPMVKEEPYDSYCIEPKPGASASKVIKGVVKRVPATLIDTPANLKWRDATIDFANGKISPKAWLAKVGGLSATVHFLSSPRTAPLRKATGNDTRRSVLAEMVLMSVPGKPCIAADDTGQTRYLPGPGAYESWLLGMRDFLGPMLSLRAEVPALVNQKPHVIRADAKPGLLIFEQVTKSKTLTFFVNNGPRLEVLEGLDTSKPLGVSIGLDMEAEKPRLQPGGFLVSEVEAAPKG